MSYQSVTQRFLTHFDLRSRRPDLEYLSQLVYAFAQLPYENLTKILKNYRTGDPTSKLRMPDEVIEDHIRYGTGGTCFSLTFTLWQILEGCGFDCYPVMADRSYGPDTHCALVVLLQKQKFLVDPGFLLSRPLPLTHEPVAVHKFPMNFIQLERLEAGNLMGTASGYRVYTLNKSGKKWRYTLKDRPVSVEEFREHWLKSFSWNMMNSLLVTRITHETQLYLRDNYLQVTSEGQRNQRKIRSDYARVISEIFGIPEEIILEAQQIVKQQKLSVVRSP
jgi:arylamine N-acetyltransferase